MIRVAHFFEGPQVFGAVTSMKRLLDHLDRRRFEPVLIAAVPGGFVDQLNQSGYKVRILNSKLASMMVDILGSGSKNPFRFFELYMVMRREAKKLRALLDAEHIDILHTHHHHHHMLGAMACRKDTPNVWHMRAIINPYSLYGLQWRLLNYFAYKYSSHIIAISSAVRESMAKKVREKTSVIYNGIDIKRFTFSAAESKRMLGFGPDVLLVGAVGRFAFLKGFGDFISMAEIVAPKHKDVHFVLIGPDEGGGPEYRYKCLRQIELADLTERFTIRGPLHNPASFMPALDIVVMPTTTWEGFGNVVLEAQACGRPVVATDCGGPRDVIIEGQTGFIVPVRDYGAMAEKVLKLLSDKNLIRRMGAAGRARASEPQFNIANTVKQVEVLYVSLVTE